MNYEIRLKILEQRLDEALDTDTENPIYTDHNTVTIRNLLQSIEITRRIIERENGDGR